MSLQRLALDIIDCERHRQIYEEGFTPDKDDKYTRNELVLAAASYALPPDSCYRKYLKSIWPWAEYWDKRDKHSRTKQLAIAGALILAELERILRKEANELPEFTAPDPEKYM